MKYTLTVDTNTEAGRKIMEIAKKTRKGVEIENPAVSGIVPEGYMTGDEFVRRTKEGLTKRLKDNGYL